MTQFRPSRFEILPPVIKNLLIINGLFFLAQNVLTGPDMHFSFDDTFALHAWQSSLFKPWQLLTHLFLHGGFSHIFFNMLALWMFGAVLENIWGSKRFLAFYLVCGLGAALIHLLFLSYEFIPMMKDYAFIFQQHTEGAETQGIAMADFISKYHIRFNADGESLLPYLRSGQSSPEVNLNIFKNITAYYENNINTATIGASGAVFGVLAAFGYLFPNTQIYVYFLFPIKAKWFVLFYGAIELYEGVSNSAGDTVAHWAHVGGALVGLLIVITWNKTNKKTLY
jgi:membrane associated rhomboid family serine protease